MQSKYGEAWMKKKIYWIIFICWYSLGLLYHLCTLKLSTTPPPHQERNKRKIANIFNIKFFKIHQYLLCNYIAFQNLTSIRFHSYLFNSSTYYCIQYSLWVCSVHQNKSLDLNVKEKMPERKQREKKNMKTLWLLHATKEMELVPYRIILLINVR